MHSCMHAIYLFVDVIFQEQFFLVFPLMRIPLVDQKLPKLAYLAAFFVALLLQARQSLEEVARLK